MDGSGNGFQRLDADEQTIWQRENLAQRVYDHVSLCLVSGAISPGEKLTLRPLAAHLGLSPTPAREALLRLVTEQALEPDARGSILVPRMTAEQLRELCDMRSDLEARAAERAVRSATPSDLHELQRLSDLTVRLWHDGRWQDMLMAAAHFHRQICVVGRSPLIQRALEGLRMRLGPSYALALHRLEAPLDAGPEARRDLMAALRTGNIDAVRTASTRVSELARDIIGAALPAT